MNSAKIFYLLLALDVLMVILHLAFGTSIGFFHLDLEQNLPTAYQSFKLISFGSLFLWLTLKKGSQNKLRAFTLPLSFFMIILGLDELLQIHENIYRLFEFVPTLHPSKIVTASMKLGYRSSLWILYYIPAIFVFVFWSGYWVRYFQTKLRTNFWLIILCTLSVMTILLAEIASSTGSFSESGYFWLITIEETAEMLLGSMLIFVGSKVIRTFR